MADDEAADRPGVEAVLLDFGGVFTMSPFEALRSMETELGHSFIDLLPVVFGDYDDDTDHPWHRVERGEIPFDEARLGVMEEARSQGIEVDPFSVLQRMGTGGGIRTDVVDHVRRIRESGRSTALVTNNVIEFRELWRPMLPLDELFDAVIDSSEVGMRKPDPRIYELALAEIGAAAERSVFLDDYEGNVRAAERVGLRGIVVGADHRPAFAELELLLID
jgi:putative hydrolase of the HAD superfamily